MTPAEQRQQRQQQLRDRRDHLIDLLGLGQTYPLQDLPLHLPTDPYLITYNNPARIGIETSQHTVLYQLHEDGNLVKPTPTGDAGSDTPFERPGNQTRIQLSSYNIQEDKNFQVWATKFNYSFSLDGAFAAELNQSEVSEDLRKAFLEKAEITLADEVTITVEPENEQPTPTWIVRSGSDIQSNNRFIIRSLDGLLAVYQMSERAVYLHDEAEVKVGLDQSLKAWITDAPFLKDPVPENHPLTAARLIDYGDVVQIKIENSQEGVYYRLIKGQLDDAGQYPDASRPDEDEIISIREDENNDLGTVGTSDPKPISLTTIPMTEDIDIRIRATKTFDPAEHTPSQTILLDVVLPLKVRANPALPVSVDPSSIIDFNQPATIKIGSSQPTVTYQLYRRRVPDREFIHPPDPSSGALTVSVPGQLDVQVPRPPPQPVWQLPAGYAPEGTPQPGNGGVLQLTTGPLADDNLVVVRAQKMHTDVAPDPQKPPQIPTAVQLTQALLLLVRPDPAPPIRLRVTMAGANTTGQIQVSNGQPGVFYYFRLDPTGSDVGRPAYFHQRDDGDQTQNKGLGQLALDWDFVVARSQPQNMAGGNLAQIPPQPPLLDTGPLPADTPLHIRAVKAQTRVESPLNTTPQIPSGPAINSENAVVDFGGQTKIRITSSRAKEWYQLLVAGSPLAAAVKGTGQDRLLDTGPLHTDTTFELLVTQPNDPIEVERLLPVTVQVRPDPSLQVTAAQAVVDAGAATDIQVDVSQSGVEYQLLAGGNPIGSPVPGSGATILLPTGPLTQDTTFTIRASKTAAASIFVDLTQQVTVQVRPDPSLQVTAAQTVIDSGTATDIQVDASQSGVDYQLLAGGSPVGNPVPGSGATILLSTGSLTQDTTFSVRASKAVDPNIFVDLVQQVTVQIKTSP